jgi:hypothetical protein
MTVVGVTGHSNITTGTAELVRVGLQEILLRHAGNGDGILTGISCLARGPDQIFARLVLELGGRVEAVIPASDYDQIPDLAAGARYHELLRAADVVHSMPFTVSGPEAVWDGGLPDGRGGTADAVEFARSIGREIEVIWPMGAARE